MSQTNNPLAMRPMEDSSEQWRLAGEGLGETATGSRSRSETRMGGDQDAPVIVEAATGRPMVQRLVVVSLAVTLHTMRG